VSFAELGNLNVASLPNAEAVLDGEIFALTLQADHNSKICCSAVAIRHASSHSICFNGKDLRNERLLDRKQELRRLLAKVSPPFPLRYADHVEGSGTALFQRVRELDLEGIVAKQKFGPYVTEREHSTWFKILNLCPDPCVQELIQYLAVFDHTAA